MIRMMQRAAFALLFISAPFFAIAQDDMPHRQMISEMQVDPAMQSAFEDHLKAMFSIAKDKGYPHPTYVAQWHNTYWLVTPMENYAALDRVFADRQMVWQDGGEAFQDHYKAMAKGLMSSHSWISRHVEDMSYRPDGSVSEDDIFMDIESIRFKPGHWDEVEAMLKQAKAIYTELSIPYAYDVHYEDLGAEGNQVTFLSYAENPLDHARKSAEVDAMLKEHDGWADLIKRYMKIAHSSKNIKAWMRPDLSLMPGDTE